MCLLEDEGISKRGIEERLQRPDHPDVFFEQMRGPAGTAGGDAQRIRLIPPRQ